MPYQLGRSGDEYCVMLDDDPVEGGCHKDRAEALRHLGVLRASSEKGLTPSEMAVLKLAAVGLSNKEISYTLEVSPAAIAFHLQNIYTKMHVGCRSEMLVKSLLEGVLRTENLPALLERGQEIRVKYLSEQGA